jgi:hypothetical protein
MRTTTRTRTKRTTKGRKPDKITLPVIERPPTDPLARLELHRDVGTDDEDLAEDVRVLEAAQARVALDWQVIASMLRFSHAMLREVSFEEQVRGWRPILDEKGHEIGPPKPTREGHAKDRRDGRTGLAQLRDWLSRDFKPDETERLFVAILRVSYRAGDLETAASKHLSALLTHGRDEATAAAPTTCSLVEEMRAQRGEEAVARTALAYQSTFARMAAATSSGPA